MARIFLIDQSLKDQSGHHFDYVQSLADQAKIQDLSVVVGTHRKFGAGFEPEVQVCKCFANTTYFDKSELYGLREMAGASRSKNRWALLKSRLQKSDQRFQQDYRSRFNWDLKSLLDQFEPEPDDHFFLVTVNEQELLAVTDCLQDLPAWRQAHWSFQFHFAPTDELQSTDRRGDVLADIFAEAEKGLCGIRTSFFATTNSLAKQFRTVSPFPFKSLIYPLNRQFRELAKSNGAMENRRVDKPVKVSMAGGIRWEKGTKSFLPRLLDDLNRDPKSDQFKIQFQGNPNASLAAKLRPFRDRYELVPHPLPQSDYVRFISESDIGLLNYDRTKYLNRRAGILGEFLAAGVPVIVPSACWLAEQIEPASSKYADEILSGLDSKPLEIRNESIRLSDSIESPSKPHQMLGIRIRPKEFSSSRKFGRFKIQQEKNADSKPIQHTVSLDGKESCFLMRWNPDFKSSSWTANFPVDQLEAFLISTATAIPLSAVGMIVESDREILPAMKEIANHLEHYRMSSIKHSWQWAADHSAQKTIKQLITSEGKIESAA